MQRRDVTEPTNTSVENIVKALKILEEAARQQRDELRAALSDEYTNLRKLLIGLWTVKESVGKDIVIYGWSNNAWIEVGRVPLREIASGGASRNVVHARGLMPDGACYFKIVDEVGHTRDNDVPVTM